MHCIIVVENNNYPRIPALDTAEGPREEVPHLDLLAAELAAADESRNFRPPNLALPDFDVASSRLRARLPGGGQVQRAAVRGQGHRLRLRHAHQELPPPQGEPLRRGPGMIMMTFSDV